MDTPAPTVSGLTPSAKALYVAAAAHGLPHGVFVGSLARALREMPQWLEAAIASQTHADGFAALNTAFMADGFAVLLPPGEVIERPLHMLFLADEAGLATQPFNVVLDHVGLSWGAEYLLVAGVVADERDLAVEEGRHSAVASCHHDRPIIMNATHPPASPSTVRVTFAVL